MHFGGNFMLESIIKSGWQTQVSRYSTKRSHNPSRRKFTTFFLSLCPLRHALKGYNKTKILPKSGSKQEKKVAVSIKGLQTVTCNQGFMAVFLWPGYFMDE